MRNAFRLRLLPAFPAALATALLGSVVLVPVSLAAGSLSVTNPLVADFAGVTLNGTAQTRTAALDAFGVTDSTGTGSGWNVTVQASRFAEWDPALNAGVGGYVAGGKMLPLGLLTMPAPTVTANGTSSPAPTVQAGAPWAIDAAGAVKIASAATGAGMGTYDFGSVNLTLTVPASAYAKQYRSDVTVSAVTGP